MGPGNGRVVVVFGIDFKERVDKTIAKIFMQELADARRTVRAAPPVSFGAEPPRELRNFDITENKGNLGFVSFAVLSTHVSTAAKREKVTNTLQSSGRTCSTTSNAASLTSI